MFIFFYSGHGGQVYNPNETDGCDETLCFWDGQFIDDRVWELLRKMPQEMRCFMVTDCCNSGSNYQLPYVKKVPYNLGSTKESIDYFTIFNDMVITDNLIAVNKPEGYIFKWNKNLYQLLYNKRETISPEKTQYEYLLCDFVIQCII